MNVNHLPSSNGTIPKRLLSINEATVYLGIGRNSALKFLEDIGAKRQIGRRVLYDRTQSTNTYQKLRKETAKYE